MGVLYENAEVFARRAHGDLLGTNGRLFIEHPLAVAAVFDDEITKAAAILHDVVEKTSITLTEIAEHFGDDIASLVDNLTVREGESKESQLHRALLDPRSAAIRVADALNHADVRNWQNDKGGLDADKVGSYIDKVEVILRAMGVFGSPQNYQDPLNNSTELVELGLDVR